MMTVGSVVAVTIQGRLASNLLATEESFGKVLTITLANCCLTMMWIWEPPSDNAKAMKASVEEEEGG